jgi:hypothetical protein
MIRSLLTIVAAISVWGPAFGQIIIARSGEHEGFSRIVLRIPEGTGWSLDQSRRSASLKFGKADIKVDTSQVFARISRNRLSDLRQAESGSPLEFELACPCDVSGFIQSRTLLVIDIKDPQIRPLPAGVFARPINQAPYQFSPVAPAPDQNAAPSRPRIAVAGLETAIWPRSQSPGVPFPMPQTRQLNVSERRLVAQIQRATGQGLLTPSIDVADRTPSMKSVDPRAREPQSKPAQENVSVITVIDRDMAKSDAVVRPVMTAIACMGSDAVAIQTWGTARSFGDQVSKWRSGLVEEFDRVNPGAAAGLARTYLYFGFGAEASRVLALTSVRSEDQKIFLAMADLLDQRKIADPNPFSGQQQCDGDVSLWSVLTADAVSGSVNSRAVLRAFARLPAHLRILLGPGLSRQFTESGDTQTAEAIQRAVSRINQEPDPAFEMARAATAELRGDTDVAEEILTSVAIDGSETSPAALVDLIESLWKSGAAASPDLPELAASYALEFKNRIWGRACEGPTPYPWLLLGDFLKLLRHCPILVRWTETMRKSSPWPPFCGF